MTISPNVLLYFALALYAVGTLIALASLFHRAQTMQHAALGAMIAGFASHTVWIGSVCVRTHHPPLTNLAEASSFIAWTIFVVELVLFTRYRVHAASFFVYPLVLALLTISAVVGDPIAILNPSLRSNLFTAHLLLSTVGVAALTVGVAFTILAYLQDRSLKSKTRGRLWELIPSLSACKKVSYGALATGFTIYTLGIITGILWSYRTTAEVIDFKAKQVGAVVAWVLFAVVLESYISGSSARGKRTVLLSVCAFLAILVAILGIHHA